MLLTIQLQFHHYSYFSIVDALPEYDREDKSFYAGAMGGDDKEENSTRFVRQIH